MEEDKFASFGKFRHTYTEVSGMTEGKWYDSAAFYVQGSAWKIGVKINTDERIKFLGVYLRRCSAAEEQAGRQQEYFAEVAMSLLSQRPDCSSFRREFQQKFSGGKRANYGWPQFKPWSEVLLPKNGFLIDDSFVLEASTNRAAAAGAYRELRRAEVEGRCSLLAFRAQVDLAAAPPVPVPPVRPADCRKNRKSGLGLEGGDEADEDEIQDGLSLDGATLQERGQSILDSGLGSDCEFLVSRDGLCSRSFKASQIILARASPIFERMFFGEIKAQSFIEITDMDPDAFYSMLQFSYNCKWDFKSNEHAVEVYYIAYRYRIEELKHRCVNFVWPTHVDNIWCALLLSTHFNEKELKVATIKLISEYTKSVFTHLAFLNISRESLISILEQTHLNVDSELEVFLAAKAWAINKCREKRLCEDGRHLRSELGRAIKYIRFLSFSAQDFISHPMESGILSPEESVILLRSINNKDRFLPCPHLCSLRKQRSKPE